MSHNRKFWFRQTSIPVTLLSFVAATATAEESKEVTVSRDTAVITESRLPEAYTKCATHMMTSSKLTAQLEKAKGTACEPVVALMAQAVKAGQDACLDSYHPIVRRVMQNSLHEANQVLGLQCTPEDAIAHSPCAADRCRGTIMAVNQVVNFFSTKELDNSLILYTGAKGKPEDAIMNRLVAEARKSGCTTFHPDETAKVFAELSAELIASQLVSGPRYKVGPVGPLPEIKQEKLTDEPVQLRHAEQKIVIPGDAKTDSASSTSSNAGSAAGSADVSATASADRDKTDSSGNSSHDSSIYSLAPLDNVSKGGLSLTPQVIAEFDKGIKHEGGTPTSDPQTPALPDGLHVVSQDKDLGTGFVYIDPKSGNSVIGFQKIDPKTGKPISEAYPIAGSTAQECLKDPDLLAKKFIDAQDSAKMAHRRPGDATERAQAILNKNGKAVQIDNVAVALVKDAVASAATAEQSPKTQSSEAQGKDGGHAKTQTKKQVAKINHHQAEPHRLNGNSDSETERLKQAHDNVLAHADDSKSATDSEAERLKQAHDNILARKSSGKKTSVARRSSHKPVAKKPHPDFAQFNEGGATQIRYFTRSMPPYGYFVGKVEQSGSGKMEIQYFKIEYDAAKFKAISHDKEKLKAKFEEQNRKAASNKGSLVIESNDTDSKIQDADFLDQALKQKH